MESAKIPDDALFITVEQLAAALQTTPNTIYRKIKSGVIPVSSVMDAPRIPREFIDAQTDWLKSTETFTERKLRKQLKEQTEEIACLKNTIRTMLRAGMEANL
ncbi:helix-turn-helix domain-containing protein [Proteiniclasticum sp. BAD-10]|uniref:Helix-turn-helix domain-containing protein n=1 Tax=Proteiniclasticum sediminis TaxID=2804028 RepID=A0A941CR04_9CLOT|nr:helix-turn-helix domain-containing protein [Proteiniclasticum sediminis]MBR0575721.1 helix-turn-helix domain-containing protein [Proteiniclasticum sediminis]